MDGLVGEVLKRPEPGTEPHAEDYLSEHLYDFAYVSDQKLIGLITDMPRPRTRFGQIKGELKAPFVSIGVEAAHPGQPDAETQIDRLRKIVGQIDENSLPYHDSKIRPGGWIYFETPMNHCVLDGPRFNSAVVFIDHRDRLPVPSTRLLLHGSSTHLRSRPRRVDIGAHVVRMNGGTSGGEFVYELADNVAEVLRAMRASPDPLAAPAEPEGGLAPGLARIVNALDQRFDISTATWLGGFARVTASVAMAGHLDGVERLIMATPLYVEYVPASDNDTAP